MNYFFKRKALHTNTLIALLLGGSAFTLSCSAFAQGATQKSTIFTGKSTLDRQSFRTAEFYANWGLNLHKFDAAYAAGATGQHVTVGQLDNPLYTQHPELAGITFHAAGAFPSATTPKFDSGTGKPAYHGMHVAGIIAARKDGKGMHGGAFGATRFVAGDFTQEEAALAAADKQGRELGQTIVDTGADFINHSYGYNFRRYTYALPGDESGAHGPDVRNMLPFRGDRHIEFSSANGVVNVSSAGNDRYYAAYAMAFNKYDARPRLFRGISTSTGINAVPYLNANAADLDNKTWSKIEKGIVAAVILNGTNDINSYSNICGITKYWCIGGAGGMLAEPDKSYTTPLPSMPYPVDYYYPDSGGKKYVYSPLTGNVSSDQYRVLSLAVGSKAPPGSPKSVVMAPENLQPLYRMAMGTSMAAPTVTAGLAVTKSRFPYLQNWQVRDIVLSTAKDIGAPGIDRVYGWGAMDLEAAMGGPRKLFALRRNYLETLERYEIEAADQYNPIVAHADYFATKAYKLKLQMINNEQEAAQASAAGNKDEAARLLAENEQLAPVEAQFRQLAYEHELTRVQPNNPDDTAENAFEYINFEVDIPGTKSEKCADDVCVADVWTNDISGPGGLEKKGAGLLALAGNSSYTGGTTITDGVLQLGIGGDSGSVTGDITNEGSLVFARANEWAYKDSIKGSGDVSILGGGTFRLQGVNTYTGDTRVFEGNLAVDGSAVSKAVIYEGGMISGNGRVGAIHAQPGGVVSPGNSIGTLTAAKSGALAPEAGNAVFEPGSRLVIEVDGQGNHDVLKVENQAIVHGGQVDVGVASLSRKQLAQQVRLTATNPYAIVTADAGVTGKFDRAQLDIDLPFIAAGLRYSSHAVGLSLDRSSTGFGDVGLTHNQRQIGQGIETTALGHPLYDTLLTSSSRQEAARSLQQLSNIDIHASLKGSLVNDTRFMREAALEQARANGVLHVGAGAKGKQLAANNASVWGKALGSWQKHKTDGNAAGLDRNIGGLIFGMDRVLSPTWHAGALLGLSNSSLKSDTASAKVDSYQFGVYGSARHERLGVRLGAGFARHEIRTKRRGYFDTSVADKARYSANSLQAYGELGYAFETAGTAIEPFINTAYTSLKTRSFVEGGDDSVVSGKRKSTNVVSTTLGARVSSTFGNDSDTVVKVSGMLGWTHHFGNVKPVASLQYRGGEAFTVHGLPIARSAVVGQLGVQAILRKNLAVDLNYNGQFGKKVSDHAVSLGVSYTF